MAQIASVTCDTSGIDKILANLQERAQEVVDVTSRGVQAGAQNRAPIGETGVLRGSIEVVPVQPLVNDVVVGAEYGVYNELGTGRRGAASPIDRPPGITYSASWPGMPAHPFLIPAVEAWRKPFREAFKALFKR